MKIKRNKVDMIFSDVVRSANNYTCERCGKQSEPPFENGMIDNAHNFGRRYRLIRYDPRNTACLCRACHFYLGEEPDEHVHFFTHLKGEEYQICKSLRNANQKITKKDEQEIFSHYKMEMERIKQERMSGNIRKIQLEIPPVLL